MVKATHTPRRSVRVELALWAAAQARAEREGETVSDVVRRELERYVAGPLVDHVLTPTP